jgi:hypothetical protein
VSNQDAYIGTLIDKTTAEIEAIIRGGPGSGHHGHRGRPGEVGGSLPGEGFSLADAPKSFKRDQVEKVLIWILDHDRNLHSDLASNLEQTHTHGH